MVDDNTNRYCYFCTAACRVFNSGSNQALQQCGNNNYDPFNASSYSGNLSSVKNQVVLNMAPVTYEISASATPAEGGVVNGIGTYNYGSTCTLTATANTGYTFLNWTENGEVVSCNATYSFTVTEAVDLEAVFMLLEGIYIGDEEETSQYLPGYGPDNMSQYSLSQQLYTAGEIGGGNTITSISFYNAGETRVHNFNIYMAHTAKTVFDSDTDWIDVSESDRVFNGYVTMTKGYWTTIKLDRPFAYDGVNNLAVVVDDNTGSSGMGINCRVFNANGNQTLGVWNQSDNTNYNPYDLESTQGNLHSVKNQIILNKNIETPSLHVYASYYPDASNPNSHYVKVEWGMGTNKGPGVAKLDSLSYSVYRSNCDGSGMQLIAENLTGNQYIDTDWTTLAPGSFKYAVSAVPSENNVSWNLIGGYHCSSNYQYGVASDGVNIYHNSWSSNAGFQFAKYDMEGNIIETFEISECGYLRDMTYDGQYFYGGSADSVLYCVDLANKHLVSTTATACEAIRYCAYDPVRDGFWVGNWNTSIKFINRLGEVLIIGPEGNSIGGAAYYKDERNVEHVYLYAQPSHNAIIYDYDIVSNAISTTPIYSVSDNLPGANGTSGGCFIGDAFGKVALYAGVQQSPNYVGIFEMSPLTWSDCIEKSISITQSTALNSGWNWWSTYIEQDGAEGLEQLENSLGSSGLMIKSRSDGYVESYEYNGVTGWFGQLTMLSNEQMYKINMSGEGSAVVSGTVAGTASHPITINSGWNWIGYPNPQQVNVEDALAGFDASVDDVLKGRNGFTTYYSYDGSSGWFGTLNTLEPGGGYMYQSQSSNPKTLVYQGGQGKTARPNITPDDNVYRPQAKRYADNMTVTAVVETDGEELRSTLYELSAFANGECRGSVRLMYVEPVDRYVAFLTVFGETGDELEFRLTNGVETWVSDDQITFVADGVEGTLSDPRVIHFGTTGVGEASTMVRIYPNPVEQGGLLNIILPGASGMFEVEICNLLGVTVFGSKVAVTPASNAHITLPDPMVPGTYVLKAVDKDGAIYYGRIVVK